MKKVSKKRNQRTEIKCVSTGLQTSKMLFGKRDPGVYWEIIRIMRFSKSCLVRNQQINYLKGNRKRWTKVVKRQENTEVFQKIASRWPQKLTV